MSQLKKTNEDWLFLLEKEATEQECRIVCGDCDAQPYLALLLRWQILMQKSLFPVCPNLHVVMPGCKLRSLLPS